MAARIRTTSCLAYTEARAALAAAARAKRLKANAHAQAVTDLEAALAATYLTDVDQELTRLAGDLAERHSLRGYDAVHLATALSFDDPNIVIVTWDRDLSAAARASAHSVAPILT